MHSGVVVAQGKKYLFNKFNPPVVDGGQIYIPNYNGASMSTDQPLDESAPMQAEVA
jgi:hypothetical protein